MNLEYSILTGLVAKGTQTVKCVALCTATVPSSRCPKAAPNLRHACLWAASQATVQGLSEPSLPKRHTNTHESRSSQNTPVYDELGVGESQEAGQLLGVVSRLCLRQVVQLVNIVKQLATWDKAKAQHIECTQVRQ